MPTKPIGPARFLLGFESGQPFAELGRLEPLDPFHRVVGTAAAVLIEMGSAVQGIALAIDRCLANDPGILTLGDLVNPHVERLRDGHLMLQLLVLALRLGRGGTHLKLPCRDEDQFHIDGVGDRLLSLFLAL